MLLGSFAFIGNRAERGGSEDQSEARQIHPQWSLKIGTLDRVNLDDDQRQWWIGLEFPVQKPRVELNLSRGDSQ